MGPRRPFVTHVTHTGCRHTGASSHPQGPMAASSGPQYLPSPFHGHGGVLWPFVWPRSVCPPPAINRGLLPLDDTAERSPPRRPLHTLRLHGSYSENLASFQKSDHWLEGHELWTFQFTFTRLCPSLCLHVARFPAGPRRAEC